MSYSRRFSRTVEVHYSGSETVSYPASENGGSMTVDYSGTAEEEVVVDVEVDTVPFDNSVSSCNDHVNVLTGSVQAMNAAQCVAVSKNAETVSKTIIDGFFQTVRTDLGTQTVELQQTIEARLLLLRQQAAMLQDKRRTMEEDYRRTSARYQKIFDDLNRELSVRIHEADQPVFDAAQAVDRQSDRMLHTDLVQTAVTMGKESSLLQAQLGVATVKKHALEAMSKARDFLTSKAEAERTICETTTEGSGNEKYWMPVCYVRMESENHTEEQRCFYPEFRAGDGTLGQRLCSALDESEFAELNAGEIEQVKSYIQSEIATALPGEDRHSQRVREMINKMLNR